MKDEMRVDGVEMQLDEEIFLKDWLRSASTDKLLAKRAMDLYRDLRGLAA